MGEEPGTDVVVPLAHKTLPFRMADIQLAKPLPERIPWSHELDSLRREWNFQFRLLRIDWNKQHVGAMVMGMLALLLGSVSTDLLDGGDATVSGIDGLVAIDGFQFFQILLSLLCWAWFTYQLWTLYPVMRVHAVSLLIMWNSFTIAQIFYHRNNPTFPFGFALSDMMEGTLIFLIVLFFLFFFWKAVIETRDLHVEVHHVHEDVRVMEAELAEHSLKGWSALFGIWIGLITLSTWAGLHHVAEFGERNVGFLVLHLITGLPAVPLLLFILWYPQKMLGDQAKIRTRAALDAALEMQEITPSHTSLSACPDCNEPSLVRRSDTGVLSHPCLSTGCTAMVPIATVCPQCNEQMPNRLECKACGVNAPALDFFPDTEAW